MVHVRNEGVCTGGIGNEYNLGMLKRTLALALGLLCSFSASAQSLHVQSPAPLRAGTNHASVDSVVGDHYWFFYAEPGHFQLRFSYRSQEGLDTKGHPAAGAIFAPKTPGAVIRYKDLHGGTVWDGSVTRRTRVTIEVDPKKSPRGRQTSDYTLIASGNVSFGSKRKIE
jgi:hypothetical protein